MQKSETYDKLNSAWKHTCKVLFKEDVGDLNEYEKWLSSLIEPLPNRKSSVSGKEVFYHSNYYPEEAKSVALNELRQDRAFKPLSINEIKDVDSITRAIQERVYYSGDIILGNSKFVESSSNITDCFYVAGSATIADSKNIAFCNNLRYCESLFGCSTGGQSEFSIRLIELYENSRCLETWTSDTCTDLYYCHGMQGCSEAMFSFNQSGKRRIIGNLELSRDNYAKIKGHVLEQLRAELSKNKKLPSLMEIARESGKPNARFLHLDAPEKNGDFSQIESAFASTAKVIFGKPLSGIKEYAPWLSRNVREMKEGSSAISGKEMLLVNYPVTIDYPQDRTIKFDEKPKVRDLRITEEAALHFDFQSAPEHIKEIAYLCPGLDIQNANGIESPTSAYSANFFRCSLPAHAKYCAYAFWPRDSQYIFGSHTLFDGAFCIKCSHSKKLSRCLEADCCTNSSGLYFAHNCENVNDSMFCFNMKNLRNAIGNAEYSANEYSRVRSSLLEQMHSELENKKELKWDIYNIGCPSK